MQSKLHTPALVAAAVLGLAQLPALAQSHTFKVGPIRYDTNSRTNGVTGIGIPPGADAKVGDATTVVLTYEYEIKPNVGVEFVLGIPPTIKAKATGSVAFLGEVLSAKNVSPTVLFNYHFGSRGDTFRPYIGLGMNYTKFTDVKTPYGWDVKMSDSVGFAGQIGADYALSPSLGLYASVGKVDTKSKLVAVSGAVIQSTIDFRPMTYSVGVSFRY